jgi:hypothetical protein
MQRRVVERIANEESEKMWNEASVFCLKVSPGICLERVRKKSKRSVRITCLRYSNPGYPEYEAGVLTTRPRILFILYELSAQKMLVK